MPLSDKTIAFLGCGNIATSMAVGLVNEGLTAAQVIAVRRSEKRLQTLAAQGFRTTTDSQEAIAAADILVLAARPSQMVAFLNANAAAINERGVPVISVVAGLTIEAMRTKLRVPLIRSMPNIAGAVGAGVTIFQLDGKQDLTELRVLAGEFFAPLGLVVEAKSSAEVDSFTSLTGCGPAYFFYFVQILIEQGEARGLPPAEVSKAIVQTLKGAALLLEDSGKTPNALIDEIAPPAENTATRTALTSMQDAGLAEIIKEGCSRAERRALEVGRELGTYLKLS